jgi:signal transduction histidine kinase
LAETAEGAIPARSAVAARRPRFDAVDGLFAAAILGSLAVTLVVLLPDMHGHGILATLDLVMDTVALVVSALLTAVAWARFRENQVLSAVYQASAFLALAVAYGIAVLVTLQQAGNFGGLVDPQNVQVMVFAVAHLAAAVLFVIGGVYTSRLSYGWSPRLILVAPGLGVLLAAVVGMEFNPPPAALQIIEFADPSGLPRTTLFGAGIQLVTASLFFLGAYASRRLWHAEHAFVDGWIAIGLVFAGFGELHWTLYPSAHPGQVSTGDLFRLACSLALLFGLESAVRAGLRDLRVANAELSELRDAEVEHVALQERTRLARELHDGLAQDLWLAKMRTGELAVMEGLPPEARRAAEEAEAAIELGLGDARDAVATLRSPARGAAGFGDVIRRVVEDHGDRYGLRVVFTLDEQVTAHIAPRTQAEILRIVQETLTNIARHANATVIGVRLTIKGERIMLRVVDNGRGFDPRGVDQDRYGLTSMRERAVLIGGHLRIASRAGAGTRILLTAPFGRPSAVAATEHR